jgi:hypothetical protein
LKHGRRGIFKIPRRILIGKPSLAEARPYAELRDLQGVTQIAGTLSFSGGRWKTAGMLRGSELSMNTVRVERFSSQFQFSPESLHLTGIQMTGLRGKAEGQLSSPLLSATKRIRLSKIGLLDLSPLAGLEKVRFAGKSVESSRLPGSTEDNDGR